MRIEDVTTRIVSRSYEGRFSNPHMAWTEKHALIVIVTLEDGTVGIGEAWCDGGDPQRVADFIGSDLAPKVIGEPVQRPARLWTLMMSDMVMSQRGGALYAAVGGVDTAVWDALARTVGLPLSQLLGGESDSVHTYASGGFYAEGYRPDDLAEDMAAGLQAGAVGVKVKAGLSRDLDEEEARIAAVRKAIGPEAWLMADFLFAPDRAHAVRVARRIAPYDIRFLEAPTSLSDMEGWRLVGERSGLPLAGPEMSSGLDRFRDALLVANVDYLQLDVTLCGGITEAVRIAGLAKAHNRLLSLHCSGSAVSLAANAQFACAFGADSVEYHLLHQTLFCHLWSEGWSLEGGRLRPPDTPGLGLELPRDLNA
ncbi:MAG: mandelate racemase/muconate lactonizing enzyme family protein [Pseudomonadota bacterium]